MDNLRHRQIVMVTTPHMMQANLFPLLPGLGRRLESKLHLCLGVPMHEGANADLHFM